MEIALGITALLLLLMTFLATADMAFGQLSDVGLRRLITEVEEERPAARATAFLKEVLENRPRFRFTLSAVIQILLVAVTVLITSVSLFLFSGTRFLLIAFAASLVLAGIFRQFIPRLISGRNPERTLLLLLPFVRPFYHLFVFIADPLHQVFSRRRKERAVIEASADEDEDDGDDIQALIDVGEEEGIL
ncbi:MAG TPA: CNNM domain-containing protein, partial [Pyrinomonadaceae bacterium]|nr:CNNM domain-containing protein [Pyrinomonadaceae bacterium]